MNPDSGTTLIVNAALVAALVPILTVIGQAIKGPLHIPDDWMPLVNAVIGAALAVVYSLQTGQAQTWGPVAMAAISGAFAGFTTGKAYDGAKRVGMIRSTPVVAPAEAPAHHRQPTRHNMPPSTPPAP
jgi:drug/metabolite transporter (DMT)-like permease